MRKILGILVLAALWAIPSMAADFKIYGAYWDTKDAGNTFGGGLGFGIPLGASPLSIAVSGTYFKELSDRPLRNLFNQGENFFARNNLRVTPVEAGLQWDFMPNSNWSPWVEGGVSYYFLSNSRHGIDMNNETGWHASVGTRIGSREGGNFFAEAIYRSATSTVRRNDLTGTTTLSDRVRLNLDGLGVNAGFLWHW